jgi:hypothetical protein
MPLGEGDEEKNAPGTGFLGDQPLVDSYAEQQGSADAQPNAPAGDGKTLSDLEHELHAHESTTADAPQDETQPAPHQDIPVIPPTAPAPASDVADDPIVSAFNNNGAMLPPVSDAPANGINPSTPPAFGLPQNDDVSSVPDMPVPVNPAPAPNPSVNVDSARDAVAQAMNGSTGNQPFAPIEALNAQPLGSPLNNEPQNNMPQQEAPAPVFSPQGAGFPQPPTDSPDAPPSVPPPMMPPMPPAR